MNGLTYRTLTIDIDRRGISNNVHREIPPKTCISCSFCSEWHFTSCIYKQNSLSASVIKGTCHAGSEAFERLAYSLKGSITKVLVLEYEAGLK